MTRQHTLSVDEDSAGMRLDKFLSAQLPDISRARLQALIEAGAVTRGTSPLAGEATRLNERSEFSRSLSAEALAKADGEGAQSGADHRHAPLPNPPRKGEGATEQASRAPLLTTHHPLPSASSKVKQGETYQLTIPDTIPLDLTPATNIALDIVYEDADILILNKQAGLTVHPAAGTKADTLVHALIHHCGDSLSGIGGVARPGIVHRIDKDTSGLMAVAKNDAAHQHLSAQLKERTLTRTYIAYCWSAPAPRTGQVEAPIARNPRDRKAMAVVKDGKYALTHYETLASYHIPGNITPLAAKVLCELETGRTHQIRVHLHHIKCALIGDPVYGLSMGQRLQRLKASGYQLTPEAIAFFEGFRRQALHAIGLRLIHPKTEEVTEFETDLPDDLKQLETILDSLTIRA